MADYLSAELYKVVHRKYTWIALGLFLGCVVLLTALWWATNSHGGFVPLSGALYTLVMLLSVGLYAPLITTDLVFSEQYKIGTLKNEISYGIPRSRIYLGKLVLEIAVAVLACALAVGLYLALCVPTLPLEADPDGMLMAGAGGPVPAVRLSPVAGSPGGDSPVLFPVPRRRGGSLRRRRRGGRNPGAAQAAGAAAEPPVPDGASPLHPGGPHGQLGLPHLGVLAHRPGVARRQHSAGPVAVPTQGDQLMPNRGGGEDAQLHQRGAL